MSVQKAQLLFISLLFVLSVAVALGDSSSPTNRILVVKSREIPFYDSTLSGFIDGLKARGYDIGGNTVLTVISLTGNAGKDDAVVKGQLAKPDSLIFTLGTDATIAVQSDHPGAPCLFSMIIDPISLGVAKSLTDPGENFTGTTLLVDPGKQLEALQQVAGQVKRIGVVYTDGDATSLAFLSLASQEATGLGIQVVSSPVTNYEQNGRQVLQELVGKVDAFWLIVDPSSAGSEALSDTLAIAKQNHLPVLGMSSSNVKAGALISLSANLRDLGDLDAEMACPLLDGTSSASTMPVRGPRQTILSINLDSAKVLGQNVPGSVLHLADEVIDSSATAAGN